jgi:hypothetical protein
MFAVLFSSEKVGNMYFYYFGMQGLYGIGKDYGCVSERSGVKYDAVNISMFEQALNDVSLAIRLIAMQINFLKSRL